MGMKRGGKNRLHTLHKHICRAPIVVNDLRNVSAIAVRYVYRAANSKQRIDINGALRRYAVSLTFRQHRENAFTATLSYSSTRVSHKRVLHASDRRFTRLRIRYTVTIWSVACGERSDSAGEEMHACHRTRLITAFSIY